MSVDASVRRCGRCGAQIARDNQAQLCSACAGSVGIDAPPQVPPEFWNHPPLRQALANRHMGKVIHAWRSHPWHGRHPIAQATVAAWCSMSQAKLSTIETGKAPMHLDRLYHWARLLQIPADLRWFLLPDEATTAEMVEGIQPGAGGSAAKLRINVQEALDKAFTSASDDVRAHSAVIGPARGAPPVGSSSPRYGGLAGTGRWSSSAYSVVDPWEAAARMAAQESSYHAAQSGGVSDPAGIEHLQVSVYRLARDYHAVPPEQMLVAAREVRDVTYGQMGRTTRPGELSDLYLVAAQSCGLMALASFDLSFGDPAEDQIRAAHTYADLVGHAGMRSWLRGTQAFITYWRGQPRRAASLADAGLDDAPPGIATARLLGIRARAWAHIGDVDEVRGSLRLADAAMNEASGDDDLHDRVGGEFGWGPSLHEACAGTALLQVGDAEGAARRVRAALHHWAGDSSAALVPERAWVDLAAAELVAGSLDAADDALGHVWTVPAPHRRHGLTLRMDGIAQQLVGRSWQGSHDAGQLRERIEVFTREAVMHRALPA